MDYYYWIVIKFLIGFFLIIAYLNISGKTQISQLTPIDLVGNFVLGGIIGGITYNDKIPIYQYIIVLLIGLLIIFCLNFFAKHFTLFRSFTSGDPIPIIKNKQFLMKNILEKKNKIDILNVASQLRVKGIYSVKEITYAQIEPNGDLTVSCDKNKIPGEIILHNGKIRPNALKRIDKNKKWVMAKIKNAGLCQKDIFILEFHQNILFFVMKDGYLKIETDDVI